MDTYIDARVDEVVETCAKVLDPPSELKTPQERTQFRAEAHAKIIAAVRALAQMCHTLVDVVRFLEDDMMAEEPPGSSEGAPQPAPEKKE